MITKKNIAITILLLCNVCLIYKIYNKDETQKYVSEKSKMLTNDYLNIIKYDCERQIDYNLTVRDIDDNISLVSDIVGEGKRLIIRYSELNCQSCVDTLLYYSQQFANAVGKDKVNVWANYTSRRSFLLLSRLNKYNMEIFDARDFSFPIDSLNTPYMFILNEDMTISNVFIPHKEFPNLYKWYFNEMKQKLMLF